MQVKYYLELMRPYNCIFAAIATYIGYSVAVGSFTLNTEIFFGMIAVFFVCAGGQAINDFFDRKIDQKLNPQKPIPAGKITPHSALHFSGFLFVIGILATTSLPLISTLIASAFAILLIIYSGVLQRAKFIGNFVVALGTAFTLIFGATIYGNIGVVGILAVSAFYANVAREIIKDLEDEQSDKGSKQTLPMITHKKIVYAFVLLFYLSAIATAILPLVLGVYGNQYYLVIISLASIGFLLSTWITFKGNYLLAQSISKKSMFLAIIAFAMGLL